MNSFKILTGVINIYMLQTKKDVVYISVSPLLRSTDSQSTRLLYSLLRIRQLLRCLKVRMSFRRCRKFGRLRETLL